MADLNQMADNLSSLTLLEAAELVKMLEEKWGVSAAAPVAVAALAAAGGAAAAEEKTEFDAILTGAGEKKIRYQGGPGYYGSGPEGGQGFRRGGPEAHQDRRHQGRGRGHQEAD